MYIISYLNQMASTSNDFLGVGGIAGASEHPYLILAF
jgi:hypothetical protein